MKTDASSESKALPLARYLKEFVGLRSTTVYDVNKYESVLWFGDMPQEPECQSPAWNDEFVPGDPWLVVHKQQFPKPPVPPEIILPWIDQQALKRAAAAGAHEHPVVLGRCSGRHPDWRVAGHRSARDHRHAAADHQSIRNIKAYSPPRAKSSIGRAALTSREGFLLLSPPGLEA